MPLLPHSYYYLLEEANAGRSRQDRITHEKIALRARAFHPDSIPVRRATVTHWINRDEVAPVWFRELMDVVLADAEREERSP